jgi:hypothetical protein
MRWVVLAFLAGCATEQRPYQAAEPIQKVAGREPAVRLSFNDALSRPVQLGGQERVTVVIFFSRNSKDAAGELSKRVDEDLLDGPVDMVSVVDLRKYSGALPSAIARKKLKKSQEDGRTRRRERRQQRGVDASDSFVDRWHLVGDFDGKIFDAFHVDPEPNPPVVFIVDRSGAFLGPYSDVETVLGAVHQSLHGQRRARTAPGGPGHVARPPRVEEVPAHRRDGLAVGLEDDHPRAA